MGRLAEPAEILAAVEAALCGARLRAALARRPARARDRRRHARADRLRPLRRQPLVGPDGRGAGGGGRAPRRRGHAGRGERVAAVAGGRRVRSTSRRPPSSRPRRASAFADADVLLMAAAVPTSGPREAVDDKIKKAGRDGLALELEPTDGRAGRAVAPSGGPTRRWSASPPSTARAAVERARGKLERKGLDAVVVNDISRSRHRLRRRPRTRSRSSRAAGERAVARGARRTAVAAAILDEVRELEDAGRRADYREPEA